MFPSRQRSLATLITLLLLVAANSASAIPFLDYRAESWFLPQSPTVTGGPVGGLFNPSAFAMSDVAGTDFWWNDGNVRSGLDNYGFGVGRGLNFAMNTTTYGNSADSYKIYDYQIGLAGGTRAHTFGMGYRWSNGETQRTAREKALVVGVTNRCRNWFNFGASGILSFESTAAQYVFDVGVRPFQKDFLTVFADYTFNNNDVVFQTGSWGAGIELRPIDGVHLGLRAREREGSSDIDYSALLGVTVGFSNFTAQSQYDDEGNHQRMNYLLRANIPAKGLPRPFAAMGSHERFYSMSLENKVLTYQKYRLFDKTRVAWLDLLSVLNSVRDDDKIDIVVLNLAGFRARPSLIWEFRQKLLEIQASGKEIIIHTDRTNAQTYYVASMANSISIDPMGSISIPGLALSRSYLKGTLEKLGLGFQAHRYFKYKSAVETLSRDSMSEADREQRQRITDVIYELLRDGAADSRGLTSDQMDDLIDNKGFLTANEAKEAGLVDIIGRWETVIAALTSQRGARPYGQVPNDGHREFWDEQWGQPVKIPVVYAVGTCAMDSGIKGRKTSAYLRRLARDPDVKAVVLRVDSPGGDPLPSDLIAEAIRILKAAGKPVIVSQGDVAASGGYWISMDGTKILTTPMTITGSIGVISGWIWNDGFAEKMGITNDIVSRGAHSDLYANVRVPFLGGIPHRAMNDHELERAETVIRSMYDDFVSGVAEGRGMDKEAVHDVAQGRVWMGGDAIEKGLCDSYGTLDDAIQMARRAGGVADWREIEIVEYPPRPLIQWPSFGPKIPGLFGLGERINAQLARWSGLDSGTEPATVAIPPMVPGLTAFDVEYLQSIAGSMGDASLLISPDMLPEAWQSVE